MSTSNKNQIIININQREISPALKDNELIQQEKYQTIRTAIKDHIEKLTRHGQSNSNSPKPPGSGWSYFIDGTRGAGKSTFLNFTKTALETDKEINSKISFFDIIDPSRIEHSEIPLLIILQKIRERVEEATRKSHYGHDTTDYDAWRKSFKQVAGGLSLFSKDFHPLNDLDPDLFLDWGLERTSDSLNLRNCLHRLFERACKILGVEALIFGFDDADTDSTLAMPLLESIRKYLDTPHVMVIVTGDMELYSLLVQQRFSTTVAGKKDAVLDLQRKASTGDRSEQYIRMIDHLEEQYLLKLFPIRRRLQLKPLLHIIKDGKTECLISADGEVHEEHQVRRVLELMISKGLRVKNPSDISLYVDLLLAQPMRTLSQLIGHCTPLIINEQTKKIDFENKEWDVKFSQELCSSLQATSLTSLYKIGLATDAIAADDFPALTEALFDLSLQDGDFDGAYYLRPKSSSHDIKLGFSYLAAEVSRYCAQNPGKALRFMLRGPGSVSTYARNANEQSQPTGKEQSNYLRQFSSYMGVGRNEDSLDWARRATAVISQPFFSGINKTAIGAGIIGLRAKKRNGAEEEIFRKAFKKLRENGHSATAELGTINIFSQTSSRTYTSIYIIIALIEELLTNGKDARTAYNKALSSVSVSSPVWNDMKSKASASEEGNDEDVDDGEDEVEGSEIKEKNPDQALWERIEIWLKNIEGTKKKTLPSSIFLGKVWARMHYSLENAAQANRGSGFATTMEIFALCVINAFLVEEADHHLHAAPQANLTINRKNPKTSASNYLDNLKSAPDIGNLTAEKFPFTSIIASCPLMLGLLNAGEKYADSFKNLIPTGDENERSSFIDDNLCPAAYYKTLNKISIAGEKIPVKKTRATKTASKISPESSTGSETA